MLQCVTVRNFFLHATFIRFMSNCGGKVQNTLKSKCVIIIFSLTTSNEKNSELESRSVQDLQLSKFLGFLYFMLCIICIILLAYQ
jgi:ABC-type amino acid transport system permease subunit